MRAIVTQSSTDESKLESAGYLIRGMKSLSTKWMPISLKAFADADNRRNAMDQQRLAVALTRVVLYAIVVELVVKHLWENENDETAEYTHNVHELFSQLDKKTQRSIEELYEDCCRAYTRAIQVGRQQHDEKAVGVEMASLDEALQWNETTVRDFKYEMRPTGHRSVPTGVFWDSETMWVLPPELPIFAIELTHWATRHSPRSRS